jgi:hypothetical protein
MVLTSKDHTTSKDTTSKDTTSKDWLVYVALIVVNHNNLASIIKSQGTILLANCRNRLAVRYATRGEQMMQFMYFSAIYSMLVFIGSYVIANTRQGDKVNLAFLQFLGSFLSGWALVLSLLIPHIARWIRYSNPFIFLPC